jgi:hypothetical protein
MTLRSGINIIRPNTRKPKLRNVESSRTRMCLSAQSSRAVVGYFCCVCFLVVPVQFSFLQCFASSGILYICFLIPVASNMLSSIIYIVHTVAHCNILLLGAFFAK